MYKFRYKARYKEIGSENEICALLIGKSDDPIIPNPEEVSDYKWIGLNELKRAISLNPEKFTPWFKMEANELFSAYKKDITNL